MLALDATFEVVGAGGVRRVPAAAFFPADRQTALQPGELLAAAWIRPPAADSRRAAC